MVPGSEGGRGSWFRGWSWFLVWFLVPRVAWVRRTVNPPVCLALFDMNHSSECEIKYQLEDARWRSHGPPCPPKFQCGRTRKCSSRVKKSTIYANDQKGHRTRNIEIGGGGLEKKDGLSHTMVLFFTLNGPRQHELHRLIDCLID